MAIVKFQQEQNRGAAGESIRSPKTGYNFANLYSLNRNNEAGKKQAEFKSQYDSITGQGNSAQSLQKTQGGAAGLAQNDMASAVNKAKGLANTVQNYDPAVQAMKAGQSAYQSGVSSFYGGGANNPSIGKIRGFSNIYQNLLGQQGRMNSYAADQAAKPNVGIAPAGKPPMTQAMQDAAATDVSNEQKNAANSRSPEADVTHNLSNLDWMLKTGRITNQEYYRAQRDNDFYKIISDKYN